MRTTEATVRRGPHAIPVYAVRLADDFHRFYHHNRVLGSEAESFRGAEHLRAIQAEAREIVAAALRATR